MHAHSLTLSLSLSPSISPSHWPSETFVRSPDTASEEKVPAASLVRDVKLVTSRGKGERLITLVHSVINLYPRTARRHVIH